MSTPKGIVELDADDLKPLAFRPEDFEIPQGVIKGWGRIGNNTGEKLAVYGPKHPNDSSSFDNSLYLLPNGYWTPDNWDCDGFYVPNDRIADQRLSDVNGPLAIKYTDAHPPVLIQKSSSNAYRCHDNFGAFRPGQINWPIPNVPQSVIENQ